MGSLSGSMAKVERSVENGDSCCAWAAMREIRERSADVKEGASAGKVFGAGSGGLALFVRVDGRKKGAFFGCCGGLIGLFRCRIVSRLRSVCHRD